MIWLGVGLGAGYLLGLLTMAVLIVGKGGITDG